MKFTLFILALAISSSLAEEENLLKQQWSSFKKTYAKIYANEAEDLKRFQIWKTNGEVIKKHNEEANKGVHTYWMGHNEFTDLTSEEFLSQYTGINIDADVEHTTDNIFKYAENLNIPETVDWREHGFVTPIRNQGGCGSCYAFTTVGVLEGQIFNKTGKLISLSEQNIVDCSNDEKYGNKGCLGGLMTNSYKYIIDNRGIDTEKSYPYYGNDTRECAYDPNNSAAQVVGYVEVEKDEKALQQAVGTVGPVSVGINAIPQFQMYKSGVFNDVCLGLPLNHAVLIVGYGRVDQGEYWLIKNSWGTSWGDQGFGLMGRNKLFNCGIHKLASYPLV